eukprot:TRINITY_DN6495_c0_g1_i1.p1 TRINITY_DN6495_c0_g1~~TRINITY_DN6495_c0_g1_i1.p1  ORF type:complete len:405 (+),score=122.49 TRINITY_DN6495_c0_g1_i1:121-1215(+)
MIASTLLSLLVVLAVCASTASAKCTVSNQCTCAIEKVRRVSVSHTDAGLSIKFNTNGNADTACYDVKARIPGGEWSKLNKCISGEGTKVVDMDKVMERLSISASQFRGDIDIKIRAKDKQYANADTCGQLKSGWKRATSIYFASCAFRTKNNKVVIQAESLSLVDDWETASSIAGSTGNGYIEWTGPSVNSRITTGIINTQIRVDKAGTYRIQWRSFVGEGTNPTEHNDGWLNFPDAEEFFGYRDTDDNTQTLVYPKPLCEDQTFLNQVMQRPGVTLAKCSNGASDQGFFKVYRHGAIDDWVWNTCTSDSDCHYLGVTFSAPGVYTMQVAARADFYLIDRIVIYKIDSVDSAVATDLDHSETKC